MVNPPGDLHKNDVHRTKIEPAQCRRRVVSCAALALGPRSGRAPTHGIFILQGQRAAAVCNSFDHLVGELLQKQRHVEAERLSGLEIDH